MNDFLLLIAGAVLGVIIDRATRFFAAVTAQRRRDLRALRAQRGSNAQRVSEWLVAYYGKNGTYGCEISGRRALIPFFFHPDWGFVEEFDPATQRVTADNAAPPDPFAIDLSRIAMRQDQGQRIFDNATFYAANIETTDAFTHVNVRPTSYFSVASNLIGLEEEVFRAVLKPGVRTPLRDRYLPNLSAAAQLTLKPLSFGVNVGFVLVGSEHRQILIQTRSRSTVTYGGAKALFPSFGLAPIGRELMNGGDLIYLNFVKEYLEEFYDYEDLIDALSDRRADPLWFMELPEAAELDAAYHSGTLRIVLLGFGMDCLSGTTTISVLVELRDETLGRQIARRIVGNWEVAESTLASPGLELVELYSPGLGQLLEQGAMHTGSAFTLARIQDFYNETEHGQVTSE